MSVSKNERSHCAGFPLSFSVLEGKSHQNFMLSFPFFVQAAKSTEKLLLDQIQAEIKMLRALLRGEKIRDDHEKL